MKNCPEWPIAVGILAFGFSGGVVMSQPRCDLQNVAERYIAERFPRSDNTGLKVVIAETEHWWEFTYELPRGTLGGVPIITIDKRTCKVVHAEHTQ